FVGPVRLPVPVEGLLAEVDKVIIHLRDPRDVLVSMFFSWVYSHPGVDEGVRERHQEHGIERFVMHEAIALKEKYQLYIDNYLSLPQSTLLRYEDFVLDRPAWLQSFLEAAGANPDRGRYRKLASVNHAAGVTEENVRAHIRKAAPGDHREKLEKSTIEKLNRRLESVLTALDYTP
ncbi:MAG: sulfotransferase domain-containing protein, partial [Marinicaulis sp.]|nr:sulfotransferase domain-containing protein [Marinicaulis sp.]